MMQFGDKSFSRIGFGAWQLGNTDLFAPMSFDDGVGLVRKSINLGVRFFDTAPGYASGLSEKILGEAIKDCRNLVFITSKFGHSADGITDFAVESMETSVRDSLSRLHTGYLDALLLHNPSMSILQNKNHHFDELKRLKSLCLIRHYGVSIDHKHELETVLKYTDCDVIELLFNVFAQDSIPLFEEIRRRNILLIIKVPLDSGWLTGKYDEETVFRGVRSRWSREDIQNRLSLTKRLKTMVNDDNLTKYALSFILSFEAVGVVIPGTRTVEQLLSNLDVLNYQLPESIKQQMMDFYQTEIKPSPLPW